MTKTPKDYYSRMAGQIIGSLNIVDTGEQKSCSVSRILLKIGAPDKDKSDIQKCADNIKSSFSAGDSPKETIDIFFSRLQTNFVARPAIKKMLASLSESQGLKPEDTHAVFINTIKALSGLVDKSPKETLDALRPSVLNVRQDTNDLTSFFEGLLSACKNSKSLSAGESHSVPCRGGRSMF